MIQGKCVFAQLTDFLSQCVFDRLSIKYDGNKHVKHRGVNLDQIGKLTGIYHLKSYPEKLRRIKF